MITEQIHLTLIVDADVFVLNHLDQAIQPVNRSRRVADSLDFVITEQIHLTLIVGADVFVLNPLDQAIQPVNWCLSA